MKTFTIKYETKTGDVKTYQVRTWSLDDAINEACEQVSIANIIGVWTGKTRVL
jgi:hypothetical protein